MMLILLIVSFFSTANGQTNADFKYVESCYSAGQTLTLEAVYTGSGTPSAVQWSYSGGTGTNLVVVPSSCTLFGSVPAGYPPAERMEYMCPTTDSLPANTYRLNVTGLTSDEVTKSWGATFTPPTGTAPEADQEAIMICQVTTPDIYACLGFENCTSVDNLTKCFFVWFGMFCLIIVFIFIISMVLVRILRRRALHESHRNHKLTPCLEDTIDNSAGRRIAFIVVLIVAIVCSVVGGIPCIIKAAALAGNVLNITQVEGTQVTFPCVLQGNFTFPEWRGPPSLTIYTQFNDTSGRISKEAPAANRLQYASDNKSLILLNAIIKDSGAYQCSVQDNGYHIIRLEVLSANDGTSKYPCAITQSVSACVILGLLLIGFIFGFFLKKEICCCDCFYNCKCECCDKFVSRNCRCCECLFINGLPTWYKILWFTGIWSPIALGIVLAFLCFKQGNKAGTSNNDVNTESHPVGREMRGRHQPPQLFGANLSNRERSDSIASRRDVEMQEIDISLERSQSPDIHNRKGRGLSANYTIDDLPLVSINIPTKMTGALESIPDSASEEGKKKKKRRKKKVETEDQSD